MDSMLFPLILTCISWWGGVIGLVLLQHGKGADMGAAFGSGASGSLFGASGLGQLSEPRDGGPGHGVFPDQPGLELYGDESQPGADGSVMEQVKTQPAAPVEPAPANRRPVGFEGEGNSEVSDACGAKTGIIFFCVA
jgi:preprotein translocase subunit SecG